jgi:hypothetical protein
VIGEGWRLWFPSAPDDYRPFDYVEVEVWRKDWERPELIEPRSVAGAMNIAGLWWRPAGPLKVERK